jgi:hypothetical protein
LKNVLFDQNCKYLENPEHRDLLKDYESIFVVGKAIAQRSFDENHANFCVERNCDFLTTDLTAFQHFFKVKIIKLIQISEFHYEKPPSDRWVYRVQIVTGGKYDWSKGVKL